jgi:hypothetical protein
VKVNDQVLKVKFVAKPKVVVVRSRGLPAIRVRQIDNGFCAKVNKDMWCTGTTPAKAFANAATEFWA